MKQISIVLAIFCALSFGCSQKHKAKNGEIILFDVAETPVESITAHKESKFEVKDSSIQVETKGNITDPGILIKGNWKLSECNKLVLDLANHETQGDLRITVRLDNQDADPGKKTGVFVDRIIIPANSSKVCTVNLPPQLPYTREIGDKLFGMRRGPFQTTGIVSNIDLNNVISVALYVNSPRADWKWSVKRIVALTGPVMDVPDYMKLPPEKFFPFIDKYGQFIHKDWPGKTKTDSDMKNALERELADIDAHPGPSDWDQYGGWANGPKQKATGNFYVKKIDGKWWMVDPEGCLYWSHGPVRVTPSSAETPLDNREFYFTELPKEDSPFAQFYNTHDRSLYLYYVARNIKKTYDFSSANAMRKYGDDWYNKYGKMAHIRLRSWGMNTVGNCSDTNYCLMRKTPYTDRFELKSPTIEGSRLGWWKFNDPFHPEFRTDFRKQLKQRKNELNDPWCFGFFVDNEIAFGGPADLATWTLQSPATQPAKIEMVNRLRKKYGSIGKLNDAWQSVYADWDKILQSQVVPPQGSKDDCIAFTEVLIDAYFKGIRDEFKKAAPYKLYLGCRFAGSYEAAIRIGSKYCDVISYNIYRNTLDEFKLPDGVDKPVMIGEFHFGALDRGMFDSAQIKVANQEERGKAYVVYITSALRHPNVIGAHWHQYGEQATTGRFDGEDFQNGLVDVCDTPYPETIAKIREVGYKMYTIRSSK
ncbi:MAG: hypothetical protein LLG13_04620 [Bacteroidales bacterium]|nr:hypothetical protein [Bacteroidales bacterium]